MTFSLSFFHHSKNSVENKKSDQYIPVEMKSYHSNMSPMDEVLDNAYLTGHALSFLPLEDIANASAVNNNLHRATSFFEFSPEQLSEYAYIWSQTNQPNNPFIEPNSSIQWETILTIETLGDFIRKKYSLMEQNRWLNQNLSVDPANTNDPNIIQKTYAATIFLAELAGIVGGSYAYFRYVPWDFGLKLFLYLLPSTGILICFAAGVPAGCAAWLACMPFLFCAEAIKSIFSNHNQHKINALDLEMGQLQLEDRPEFNEFIRKLAELRSQQGGRLQIENDQIVPREVRGLRR